MTFQSTNNLYGFPQPLTRVFPAPIIAQRAPTTSDISYPIGQLWVDEAGDDYYGLVDVTAGVATWNVLASQPGNIDTLTGDSGGAITPSGGNINLLGTANQITTTGSGHSITWSLPSAITAPGSLTTTTTLASGTTLTAGSSLSVTTSAVIGTTLTATGGLTTLAALTQVGTTLINASGSAVTTIGTGGTGAVNIGNATGNTAVTGSLTASTGLVATTGGVTATAGDITATAGNVIINGAAKQLRVHGGAATDFIGTATLTNGTVTVSNTNIAATDCIFLSRSNVNASTALGVFTYSISAATSFAITALKPADGTTETGDASTVAYFIVRQV